MLKLVPVDPTPWEAMEPTGPGGWGSVGLQGRPHPGGAEAWREGLCFLAYTRPHFLILSPKLGESLRNSFSAQHFAFHLGSVRL